MLCTMHSLRCSLARAQLPGGGAASVLSACRHGRFYTNPPPKRKAAARSAAASRLDDAGGDESDKKGAATTPLPFMQMKEYARLCLPLPPEAACVPPAWRAKKLARDGAWPPEHVTLVTASELKKSVAAAVAEGARAAPKELRKALKESVRRVATAPLHFRGLGVAVGAAGAAAFSVVDWPAGDAFRRSLGLPAKDFHATLGFHPKDPHDVRKGVDTLLPPPPGGWPLGAAGVEAMRAAVLARAAALRDAQRGG
jgi:hypothetical protein